MEPSTTRRWRREFRIGHESGALESALETAGADPPSPGDRIALAREAMLQLVIDRFGGDGALIDQVKSIVLSAEDAITVLNEVESAVPTNQHLEALEAVVVFDGTRPSFLLREDEIDLATSFNTGSWREDLAPFLTELAQHAACVGRVELGVRHVATAFLVTPTLAITNRHVAQGIARFVDGRATLLGECALDFGREGGTGRKTFDRRRITEIAFAGADKVEAPIDHQRLDLAVLRVSDSALPGDAGQRHMRIGGVTASGLRDGSRFVAAVGYPSNPELHVPSRVWSEYGQVIRKLLEGDGGAKRLAPGQPVTEALEGLGEWTATHDATTINGNSGSPLVAFPVSGGHPLAAALHYGGRADGERVNFAHLLHYTGSRVGYGTQETFADFCAREGISGWSA
jgi:hypothetical protein